MTKNNPERNIVTTNDGQFIPDESAQIEGGKIPYIRGHLEVPASSEIGEKLSDFEIQEVLGRSALCQVGVNTAAAPEKKDLFWNVKKEIIEVPVKIESYGTAEEKWLGHLLEARRYDLGRILFMEQNISLDESELKDALSQGDIMIGNKYRVCEDGSLDIKVSLVEFIMSSYQLSTNSSVRKTILAHGRNALQGNQDMINTEPGKLIKPGELFIGGIELSSGKFAVKIDSYVSDEIKHLEGGTFLDAFRTTGIGERLGSNAYRQIELFNHNSSPVALNNLWIKVRFYPHDLRQAKDANVWSGLSLEEKAEIHKRGVSFTKMTNLDRQEIRDEIFLGISAEGETWGRVITTHGDSIIQREKTPRLQLTTAVTAVTDVEKRRDDYSSPAIQEFADKTRFTKDVGRVLVSHELPTKTADIDELVRSGVRTFIFKSIEVDGVAGVEQNVYLEPDLHKKVWDLSRNGVSFYFEIEGENGKELREFYKGFWVKREEKERFDKVDTVINMYGWHGHMIEDLAEDQVRAFFEGLIKVYGKERLAVSHGKGPGFMYLADKVARELGIFSIGVGICVEKIGQGKPNLAPEAILDFPSEARDYRQKLLDKVGSFSLFNIGGDGTHEESAITTCSMKLLEYLPVPMVYIDICDEDSHIWDNERKLQGELSAHRERTIQGKNLGTFEYPLAKSWIPRVKHYVKSYQEALLIMEQFHSDPCAYWNQAGILAKDIAFALKQHQKLGKDYERSLPDYLLQAAERYAQG